MHPGRVSSLALLNCYARLARDEDYPCGIPQRILTSFVDSVLDVGAASDPAMDDVQLLVPSLSGDPAFREWWARAGRRGASPAAARASIEMSFAGDVRSVLPLIDAQALILHRDPSLFSVGHAHYLADHLPHAQLVVLPGGDHLPFGADSDIVIGKCLSVLGSVRVVALGEKRCGPGATGDDDTGRGQTPGIAGRPGSPTSGPGPDPQYDGEDRGDSHISDDVSWAGDGGEEVCGVHRGSFVGGLSRCVGSGYDGGQFGVVGQQRRVVESRRRSIGRW